MAEARGLKLLSGEGGPRIEWSNTRSDRRERESQHNDNRPDDGVGLKSDSDIEGAECSDPCCCSVPNTRIDRQIDEVHCQIDEKRKDRGDQYDAGHGHVVGARHGLNGVLTQSAPGEDLLDQDSASDEIAVSIPVIVITGKSAFLNA